MTKTAWQTLQEVAGMCSISQRQDHITFLVVVGTALKGWKLQSMLDILHLILRH